jgi:hypothetical protein
MKQDRQPPLMSESLALRLLAGQMLGNDTQILFRNLKPQEMVALLLALEPLVGNRILAALPKIEGLDQNGRFIALHTCELTGVEIKFVPTADGVQILSISLEKLVDNWSDCP